MVWQLTFWIGGALAFGALWCTDTRYELGRSALAVNTIAPLFVFTLVGYVIARRDRLTASRPAIPLEAVQDAQRDWLIALPVVGVAAIFASFAMYRGDGSEALGILAVPFAPVVIWVALRAVPNDRRGGVDWIRRGRSEGVAATLLAVTPLLLPLAMHLALRGAELPAWWAERISPVGTSGIAYHAEMPWRWTTALLAAWGLDRFFGWPRSPLPTWTTGAVVAATLTFGVALGAQGADVGLGMHRNPWAVDEIPRGHLLHTLPLLHVTAGLATAIALARRPRTLAQGLATLGVVVLAGIVARLMIPTHGPWIAADVAAAAGILLVVIQAALSRRSTL